MTAAAASISSRPMCGLVMGIIVLPLTSSNDFSPPFHQSPQPFLQAHVALEAEQRASLLRTGQSPRHRIDLALGQELRLHLLASGNFQEKLQQIEQTGLDA